MRIVLFSLTLVLVSLFAAAQNSGIPAVMVKDISERPYNTSSISNDGKPIIINFWATWCSPCKRELENISTSYAEWQEETGVKLIAVSIDDARNVAKVQPYVDGKGWEYEILLDVNQDLKRAMSVNNIPHTFLVDGKGQIVWQHNSYSEGDEYQLYELVKKLAKGETIN